VVTSTTDEKARRRLGAQIGTPRGLDDLREILAILKARDLLAHVAERLPEHIRNLADEQLDNVKAMLDAVLPKHGDVPLFIQVLLMGRLAAPWQIIRLAVRAAESDDMARIAATPYSEAVPIVLGEIERMVGELKGGLKSGSAVSVISLLKWIHDAVRGLRTEVDLPVDHPLGRGLASIRGEIADILKAEIESMPGRVRRLLRSRPTNEIAPGSILDPTDVTDLGALIEVVDACRTFASELAVSEMTLRTWSELEQYLDTNTKGLVDSLRTARDADRPFRQSQVDAAARFCATVFGPDYSQVLKKAAEVAVNSERKAAQA
jgi:hypothetical protein